MPPILQEEFIRTTARLTRLNVVGSGALWVLNAAAVWPRGELVAFTLSAAAMSLTFNVLVSRFFVPRAGPVTAEVVRTVTNSVLVSIVAHHLGWPPTIWLWVPFQAVALPDRTFRLHRVQLVVWFMPIAAFSIIDGVSPAMPLAALALALYLVSYARLALDLNDAARHRHQRKLASIIEHIGDAICSVDHDMRIVTVNGTYREIARWWSGRELVPGDTLFAGGDDPVRREWRERLRRALRGEAVAPFEQRYTRGAESRVIEAALNPIRDGETIIGVTMVSRDVTARHDMDERAEALQRQLLDISRKAGMAEVASSVLHNVGNVLNSVNVSASLISDRVRDLGGGALLSRLGELLEAHAADLPAFFATDPRAKRIPELVTRLAATCESDRQLVAKELEGLRHNLEHIKAIVTVQQSQARAGGVVENVDLAAVLDDAIAVGAPGDARNGVTITRDYGAVPAVQVDRHKLLQILMNLLANARHAVRHSGRAERSVTVRLARCADEVTIAVEDNGYGIAPEHLPRIFTHGFTTKTDGHGFGLHASAGAAKEMGGELTVASEVGQGARFTLRLPLREVGAAAA